MQRYQSQPFKNKNKIASILSKQNERRQSLLINVIQTSELKRKSNSATIYSIRVLHPIETMSGSIDKTKLGAGDGLRTPTNTRSKARTAVPSSRRFTPRTPSQDSERSELMKQRLQEALESVTHEHDRTPTRCKRAQTVPEITSSKAHGGLFAASRGDQDRSMTKKCSLGSGGSVTGKGGRVQTDVEKRDTEDEEEYERNAGRRVYQQLLLNAWRHKRRDAAILADSSMQLHQQVQQLQMQVDVLQQLRQSEGRRRSEATQESCQLRVDLQKYEDKCRELLQEKDDLFRKQEQLENDLTDLKMEFASEQDNMSKICQDLIHEEKVVEDCNRVIEELKNNREMLENEIKSLEDIIQRENKRIKHLSCDIVNLENVIHGEMLRSKKYAADLDSLQILLKTERDETTKLKLELSAMEQHQTKNGHKMAEVKKRLTVINEIKRRILQENCNLKSTVGQMQILLQKEREKPWWRTSGQLMYAFIHNAAYLLLPNLPENIHCERMQITNRNATLEDSKSVKTDNSIVTATMEKS